MTMMIEMINAMSSECCSYDHIREKDHNASVTRKMPAYYSPVYSLQSTLTPLFIFAFYICSHYMKMVETDHKNT